MLSSPGPAAGKNVLPMLSVGQSLYLIRHGFTIVAFHAPDIMHWRDGKPVMPSWHVPDAILPASVSFHVASLNVLAGQ